MRAYIYVGGEIFPEGISERPHGQDLVIAADSGYHNALRLGVTPTVLVGDFDSYGEGELPSHAEILRHPPEKDLTDTQLAVSVALERGATEIALIGGLSGRLDHTLSNLAILEDLDQRRIAATVSDGNNRARFLRNNSTLLARDPRFPYLSLIAADRRVKGVDVEGCKYPLKKATLSRTLQYAVSNEITGNCAFVAVRRGGIWILESRDARA